MSRKHQKSVGARLSGATRLYRARVGAELAHLGIHAGQEGILLALGTDDGRSMSELAGTLGVQPPTITKMVGRLAANGYVQRRSSETDGRQAIVFLTPRGKKILAEIDGAVASVEATALDGIDGKDGRKLLRMLRRVAKNLGHPDDAEPDEDGAA
ncbi:MAG: winged helix-turn-helix transcriptional regulator [Bauldia sp.]|nr:winged helix-turn-helix transcriptional regulator [Bauldia sp.]MCW5717748.1 winged helix-turn-helix transcriptional regulator [Bauldia sp.]